MNGIITRKILFLIFINNLIRIYLWNKCIIVQQECVYLYSRSSRARIDQHCYTRYVYVYIWYLLCRWLSGIAGLARINDLTGIKLTWGNQYTRHPHRPHAQRYAKVGGSLYIFGGELRWWLWQELYWSYLQ